MHTHRLCLPMPVLFFHRNVRLQHVRHADGRRRHMRVLWGARHGDVRQVDATRRLLPLQVRWRRGERKPKTKLGMKRKTLGGTHNGRLRQRKTKPEKPENETKDFGGTYSARLRQWKGNRNTNLETILQTFFGIHNANFISASGDLLLQLIKIS